MEEIVLVIKKEYLKQFKKRLTLKMDMSKSDIFGLKYSFMSRDIAEYDENYKQVIPYIVIEKDGKLFLTKRLKTQSENRLHDCYSLGVGGHANIDDLGKSLCKTISNCITRELNEEMDIKNSENIKVETIGIINTNDNEVERVHVGFLYKLDLTGIDFEIKEKDKMTGNLVNINYIDRGKLEGWSKVIYDYYKGLK